MSMIKTKEPTQGELAERTRKSWAKKLEHYSDVPPAYQAFFASMQQAGEPFPFTIQCPTFEGFMRKPQDKLLCMMGHSLYVVAKDQDFEQALCYDFSNICHLQYDTCLLDSRFLVSGLSQHGEWITTQVFFNTVTDYLFKKVMAEIREWNFTTHQEKAPAANDFSIDYLKFDNFTRQCLLQGEKVLDWVWQPELSKPFAGLELAMLKDTIFYRLIFPSHIVILTGQELIHIQEDGSPRRLNSYGGVWDFVPLKMIKDVEITHDESGHLLFIVHLQDGNQIISKYLSSKKDGLENLAGMIKGLI
jgi:hypothetical protein